MFLGRFRRATHELGGLRLAKGRGRVLPPLDGKGNLELRLVAAFVDVSQRDLPLQRLHLNLLVLVDLRQVVLNHVVLPVPHRPVPLLPLRIPVAVVDVQSSVVLEVSDTELVAPLSEQVASFTEALTKSALLVLVRRLKHHVSFESINGVSLELLWGYLLLFMCHRDVVPVEEVLNHSLF